VDVIDDDDSGQKDMELEQAVEAANRVHPPKSTEYEVRSVGASEHGERLFENSQTPLEFSLRPAFASWSHQDFPFQNVPVLLLVSAQPGPVTTQSKSAPAQIEIRENDIPNTPVREWK
jgi:hypothetical protein